MGANQSVEALQSDLQDEVNSIKTELQVRSTSTASRFTALIPINILMICCKLAIGL